MPNTNFMKQLFYLLLFFLWPLNGYAQHLDTSRYVILPFNIFDYRENFPKNSIKVELNENDIIKAEKLVYKCINEYNIKQEVVFNKLHLKNPQVKREYFVIDLRKYKQQFIVVMTPKGEKVVWINFFCCQWSNWKKQLVSVKDGGNCFFNLKINLTKNKYYDLMVNGDA